MKLTDNFKSIVPETLADYFQEQCGQRNTCAASCHVKVIKLHATTTNALESYHAKIKKNEKLTLGYSYSSTIPRLRKPTDFVSLLQ